jgi:uncharacterized protein (TIGR00290 family)
MEQVLVSWSGGKDSAMALWDILMGGHYEVAALVTTVSSDYERISIHGVRRSLLEEQAATLGFVLEEVFIPKQATNAQYESSMSAVLSKYYAQGVSTVVFGDIFLEDLRSYREDTLGHLGLQALFPIWKVETVELAHRFIDAGFKAITTCVDTNVLGKEFVGREYNQDFLEELPKGVDACGENGEFHTFVYDGPVFKEAIRLRLGEKVLREGRFYYCDLIKA